jgi:hypothetical protein
MGVCWVIPPECPTIVIGGQLRACPTGSMTPCLDLCRAIREGGRYFRDTSCPV